MSFWELHLSGLPTQADLDHIAMKIREGQRIGVLEVDDSAEEEQSA